MEPLSQALRIDGLRLQVHFHPGDPPPILALHGFTGGGLDFAPLAIELERQLVAPDLPGHGGSECPGDAHQYRMPRTVSRLVGLLDALDLPRLPLLGYSMGGRTALHLACAHPDRFSALVLVGATPGIRDADERTARRRSDDLLAASILKAGQAFADSWEERPIIASQRRIAAPWGERMRQRRRASDPRGLAGSLRGMGTGRMGSLWTQLAGMPVPTLLITGQQDRKFGAIARDMLGLLPRATHVVVPSAGHCAHLEQPHEVAARVWDFLRPPT
jgi:2-succinyl-6-hydroxy-2,4-cyclohexadiene-1-carboxylate synthase